MGEGRVIPTSQVQVVQNLEGGILAEVLVAEGDVVDSGQVLLRIDNVGAAATLRENQGRILALLATVARLDAEASLAGAISFPESLADQAELRDSELALFAARREELQSSIEVLLRQEEQRRQELLELERRIEGYENSLALASEELKIMTPMVERGVAPRVDLLRLQRQLSDMQLELDSTKLAMPRAESALEESLRRQAERRANFRSAAQAELTDARVRLRSLEEALTSQRDRVERTEVRSPVRGTVQRITINTIGGVIQPGMDLVEIVPIDDTLLIEARIRPQDIAFLRPGQEANVKLTAYDFAIYGALPAAWSRSARTPSSTNPGRVTTASASAPTPTTSVLPTPRWRSCPA